MSKQLICVLAGALVLAPVALGSQLHTYEDLVEGDLGDVLAYNGATYRDANQVSGFFPDGAPFVPADLGSGFIIEQATLFYNDFPGYGSPINAMTFGTAYIPGDNLTIGPLASAWIGFDEVATSASFDLAYYENGPWGGIEYIVDAVFRGDVVASDSFIISDLGGRDNPTFNTMSIDGVDFDSLHIYAMLNGDFTAPRGMIDNLAFTSVPAPGSLLTLAAAGLIARRRR
jgi:hypothetical protein